MNPRQVVLWWISIILILLIAGVIRLTGYNFGLPYIGEVDESFMITSVFSQRGLYNQPDLHPGYPPVILWVHTLAQIAVEQFTHHSAIEKPADSIAIVRFVAAIISMLTVLIVGLLAKELGGGVAGLVAAAAMAVLPQVVFHSGFALAAPWLLLFYSLAFYTAFLAIKYDRPIWAILSVVAGLFAILSKYSAFLMIIPGFAAALWQMRLTWRPWLRALIFQSVGTTFCAAWLFLVYKVDRIIEVNGGHGEAAQFVSGGLASVLNLEQGLNLVLTVVSTHLALSVWVFFLILIAGFFCSGTLLAKPQRYGLIVIGGLSFADAWVVGSYLWLPSTRLRYLVTSAIGIIIIFSVALTRLATCAAKWVRLCQIKVILTIGIAAVWLIPQANEAWRQVRTRAEPDTRAALAAWSANSLDSAAILVELSNSRIFSREWGGYEGPYRVWLTQKLTEHPLTYWTNEHVHYAQLSETEIADLRQTNEGRTYLDQMLLLKQFPPQNQRSQWLGPTMFIFRLWRMQHELATDFGEQIRLLGFDLSQDRLRSGEILHVVLYLQAISQPTDNYNIFIHLTPLNDSVPLAQADGTPLSADRPTLRWTDLSELMISHDFQIQLPADLKPGQYQLRTGMYNFETGKRLSVGSVDSVPLAVLTVEP